MGEFLRENLPDARAYFESEGLTLQGRGKWVTTRCDFHDGSDSLRVNTASGGWCCMACGASGGDVLAYHMQAHDLDFIDAAKTLGAWQEDGKPSKPRRPKPLSANQAIQVLAFESLLTYVAAGNIAHGVQLSDTDRARLLVASQRIQAVAGEFA